MSKVTDYNMSRKPGIESDGKLYEFGPFPELGIHFPFQVYIPDNMRNNCDLIVTGRTPGEHNNETLEENIELAKAMNFSYISRGLSFKYGNPMLLPVFPRCYGIQTTSLGYLLHHNDYHEAIDWIEQGWLNFSKEELRRFDNLDEQLLHMIDYTLQFIKKEGYAVDERVVINGYSAASKLASRFSMLHPTRIKAVFAGGFGGLTFLPQEEYNGWNLTYPLGIGDVPNFDLEEFKKIKQYYYIGNEDYNDSSLPHCKMQIDHFDDDGNPIYAKDQDGNKIPLKDEEGNLILILDENGNMTAEYGEAYYSNYQINAINKGISDDVQERFDIMKNVYESLGVDATFVKYPGNHITVNDNDSLYDNVFEFYEKNILNKDKIL